MINPFERKFSMPSSEEEKLKKEGKSLQQIAEAKRKLEEATRRSKGMEASETEELSKTGVKEALEEVQKYGKESRS
ncbi:MAG: hypothetical protein HZC14_00410 [Candidatus Niyogibacteria bacterium]|nr:hypothetical protein [Candidatus Niyogibacteria bacterium]